MSYEGLTIAIFWADEARYYKRAAWEILLARLSKDGGGGIITTTPSMGWLYEEFCTGRDGRSFVHFRTDANTHLPDWFLNNLEHSYSKGRYKQYVQGLFVLLEGGVFEEFEVPLHVQSDLYVTRHPVDIGWDFGRRKPAVLFNQHFERCGRHMRNDCVHVVGELVPDDILLPRLARKVEQYYDEMDWSRGTVYCDPEGSSPDEQTGYSKIDVLEDDFGFDVEYTRAKEATLIANGIDLIKDKLKSESDRTSLYIDSSLMGDGHERGIINSLQLTQYPETKEGRPLKEKPVKDGLYDHSLDALRYYLVNKFTGKNIGLPW